jgi:uncharacterized transporter YbjL
MKAYLLARAKEASTWRGLTLFLAAVGVPLAPQLAEAIVSAGLGIAGLIGVLTPDGKR